MRREGILQPCLFNPLTSITSLKPLGHRLSKNLEARAKIPKLQILIYLHLHQPPQLKPIPKVQSRRVAEAPPSILHLNTLQRSRDPECDTA